MTPEELKKDSIVSLIKDVLGSDYLSLEVVSLEIKEDFEAGANVKIWHRASNKKRKKLLTAGGVGYVDALFKAFMELYLSEYQSLANIGLSSFSVVADNYSSQTPEGTDALVKVKICFKDAYGKIVPFVGTSRSLTRACSLSIASAYEYYINSEKCFVKLKKLVRDAESRSRGDLRDHYISQLVRIVGVSSYEEVSV